MKVTSSSQPNPEIAYPAIVGKALATIRSESGYTQADVASALGLTQSAYSRLESGASVLTVVQLRQAADKIGVIHHQILAKADEFEIALQRRGVTIVYSRQESPTAAAALGLGILAAVLLS